MHFEYQPVSGPSRQETVTLKELALNIITDWMPGIPSSLSFGFADLLDAVLEPVSWKGNVDRWALRPAVAQYEKQWRQVTSWMLGVALCRRIVELEGYPWWAPVSAFSGGPSAANTLTPGWNVSWPKTQCSVIKASTKSRLLPDYILARPGAELNSYQVAFAESKGCRDSLSKPQAGWLHQAQNAIFVVEGTAHPTTQHLLIATRVNPYAGRPPTRRVRVRAWNSRDPAARSDFGATRELLVAHYFGVCVRLGLARNAELLARSLELGMGPRRVHSADPAVSVDSDEDVRQGGDLPEEDDWERKRSDWRRRHMHLADQAHEERERTGSSSREFNVVYRVPDRTRYTFGDRNLRPGLSREALELIEALQSREDERASNVARALVPRFRYWGDRSRDDERFVVRVDGVVAELD